MILVFFAPSDHHSSRLNLKRTIREKARFAHCHSSVETTGVTIRQIFKSTFS